MLVSYGLLYFDLYFAGILNLYLWGLWGVATANEHYYILIANLKININK
jgi:hypothetical protein